MSRGFNKTTITALLTTLGRDASISPCSVIRPDNHLATISATGGICLDRSQWTKVAVLRVGNVGVLALVVTAHSHCATALLTGYIDRGLVG